MPDLPLVADSYPSSLRAKPRCGRRTVPLPPMIAHVKRLAVRAFASQLEPLSTRPGDETILGQHVLDRLTRDYEVILL